MSSGRRVRAMVIAVAALLVCLFRAALVPAWANGDDDPHAILFSGRDLWLNGAFAHGGFLFAPSGLDQDGLLLKILFSGGLYRYDAKNLGAKVSSAPKDSPTYWPDGGSSAAMRNSNSSSDLNSSGIISNRMIHQIGCAAIRSVFAWLSKFGTSRRLVPWSRPMPRCHRSRPAIQRAWPMGGACLKTFWEASTSVRSSNISGRRDIGICVWART